MYIVVDGLVYSAIDMLWYCKEFIIYLLIARFRISIELINGCPTV
jgi:hypothetical protein